MRDSSCRETAISLSLFLFDSFGEEIRREVIYKMYGFIYITTNNINGMKYIGQKQYDKNGKWKTYLGSGIYLKRAINKYGENNFTRKIIEECETKEKLDSREIYWISFYNAVNSEKFYNIANGGDGGNTIAGYSEEQLEKYKKYKSRLHKKTAPKGELCSASKLTEKQVLEIIDRLKKNDFNLDIANDYKVSTETINDIRNHKTWKTLTENIVFDDISTRKRPRGTKPIVQYSEDGQYIATYRSARDVQRELGISYKLVSAVCNGSKRIAHGFIWRFEGDSFDKYNTENLHLVKVDQYDKNGIFIKTWNSIKEVENAIGIHLSSVLNGMCKSAGGFYWCKHGEEFSIPNYQRKGRKLA